MEAEGLAVEPPDDSGAETQDRYAYQRHLITRRALQILVRGDDDESIICEWHSDYVLRRFDETELVSVKHQEESVNPWTLKQLCSRGGLKHLFQRWVDTGERYSATLETNRGLRPGDDHPGELQTACRRRDPGDLRKWAAKLVDDLVPVPDRDDDEDGEDEPQRAIGRLGELGVDREVAVDVVTAFLMKLTIISDLPRRFHIEAVHVADARLACAALELHEANAEVLYKCLYGLVEEVSRRDRLTIVAAVLRGEGDLDAQTQETIGAKTIDRQSLLEAIDRCRAPIAAKRRPDSEVPAARKLVAKLEAGGLGPITVTDARHSRMDWIDLDRVVRRATGNETPYANVCVRLVELAGRAERAIDRSAEPYGEALYSELERRLDELNLDTWELLDRRALMGAIFELTEQCELWWSPRFDLGGPQ